MTLPALDTWNVVGVRGPKYKVGPRCANPNCSRLAEHAHHIVRRSQLAGDYEWVEVEGWTVGNLTGLCPRCHDEITGRVGGHKTAIRLMNKLFVWCLIQTEPSGEIVYIPVAPLEPQPPTPDTLTGRASEGEPESEYCPTCGQTKRRRRAASSGPARRRRKTWTVKVPDDTDEDGAEVLDALIENLAPLVPNADTSTSGRYYVLVPVLAYATMESDRFVTTMKGIGG